MPGRHNRRLFGHPTRHWRHFVPSNELSHSENEQRAALRVLVLFEQVAVVVVFQFENLSRHFIILFNDQ